jgi:hypothetical protein
MRLESGTAVIQFAGRPLQSYVLQARSSFNTGEWSSIRTQQTAANGEGIFRDDEASQFPMRFYRIAKP